MNKIMTSHGEVSYDSIEQLAEEFASAIIAIKELTKPIDKPGRTTITIQEIDKEVTERYPATSYDFPAASPQTFIIERASFRTGVFWAMHKLKNVPKLDPDELWDEFSEYIDDDLFSLEQVAGASIITEQSFHDLMVKLNLAKP